MKSIDISMLCIYDFVGSSEQITTALKNKCNHRKSGSISIKFSEMSFKFHKKERFFTMNEFPFVKACVKYMT